jgi:hypothetical protein
MSPNRRVQSPSSKGMQSNTKEKSKFSNFANPNLDSGPNFTKKKQKPSILRGFKHADEFRSVALQLEVILTVLLLTSLHCHHTIIALPLHNRHITITLLSNTSTKLY